MVSTEVVRRQIKNLGGSLPFWYNAELKELPKIMREGEMIQLMVFGRYEGGTAILCATNYRILLVDKKPMFLTVEDIRYDMVAEVDFAHYFFGATMHLRSFSKDFKFKSFRKIELRKFTTHIQNKVMEQRSHSMELATKHQTPAIPMEVIDTDDTHMTDMQARSLLPVNQDQWYKIRPQSLPVNPYAQSSMTTRRRIGRFDYVDKLDS
jgi:hypothetical protein